MNKHNNDHISYVDTLSLWVNTIAICLASEFELARSECESFVLLYNNYGGYTSTDIASSISYMLYYGFRFLSQKTVKDSMDCTLKYSIFIVNLVRLCISVFLYVDSLHTKNINRFGYYGNCWRVLLSAFIHIRDYEFLSSKGIFNITIMYKIYIYNWNNIL